ncbi:hypothetical protein ACJX0J_009739, partial [Zea mays]
YKKILLHFLFDIAFSVLAACYSLESQDMIIFSLSFRLLKNKTIAVNIFTLADLHLTSFFTFMIRGK